MIERPAVFDVERRQMGGGDPQRMDFRSIVRRRLFALGYSLSDGAIVDDAGTVIVDAGDTSNSGQTPAELVAAGYSAADVAQLAGSIAPNVSGASGAASLSKPAPGGAGSASFLSGLTGLFSTIATTATNVSRASANSSINPATGVAYGIDPKTGKAYTTAGSSSTLLVLALFAVLAWWMFRTQ